MTENGSRWSETRLCYHHGGDSPGMPGDMIYDTYEVRERVELAMQMMRKVQAHQ